MIGDSDGRGSDRGVGGSVVLSVVVVELRPTTMKH